MAFERPLPMDMAAGVFPKIHKPQDPLLRVVADKFTRHPYSSNPEVVRLAKRIGYEGQETLVGKTIFAIICAKDISSQTRLVPQSSPETTLGDYVAANKKYQLGKKEFYMSDVGIKGEEIVRAIFRLDD